MRASVGVRWSIGLAIVFLVLLLAGFLFVLSRAVSVPDVTGISLDEATALLEQSHLQLGEVAQIATETVTAQRVLQQRPVAETSVRRDSAVNVTVTVAPVSVSVPNVFGDDGASAAQELTDKLFIPRVVKVFDADMKPGIVIAQIPVGGKYWMTGDPVAIAVAAGPNDGTGVVVPDVAGDSLEQCFARLGEAGLDGYAVVRDVGTPMSNMVVAQLPEGGVVVRPGTTVLLYLTLP